MLARRRSEWAYFCGRLVSKVVVFWDPKCSGHWHFVSFIIRDCWLGSTTRGSTLTIPGWHSLAVWEQRALILVGFISHVSRRAGGFTLLAQSTFGPKYCSAQFRSRRCRDTQKPAFFFATKTLFLFLSLSRLNFELSPRMPLIIVSNFAARFILRSHAPKRFPDVNLFVEQNKSH